MSMSEMIAVPKRKPLIWFSTLMSLLFLFSCSSREEVTAEEFGMKEVYQVDKKTGEKDGNFKRYTAGGQIFEEATYSEGKLTGRRTIYRDNGNIEIVENYVDGVLNGNYETYYENNTKEIEGSYIDGVMKGEWRRYYPDGTLMEVVAFDKNEENGPFTEYYENGNLKAEGTYLNGEFEHGLLKLYDEQGQLARKMECDRGICKTTWLRDDLKEQEANE